MVSIWFIFVEPFYLVLIYNDSCSYDIRIAVVVFVCQLLKDLLPVSKRLYASYQMTLRLLTNNYIRDNA